MQLLGKRRMALIEMKNNQSDSSRLSYREAKAAVRSHVKTCKNSLVVDLGNEVELSIIAGDSHRTEVSLQRLLRETALICLG